MPTPLHILRRIEHNRNQQSKILDLRWQNLLAVPPEVLTLDHLEELWLEDNAIQVVPTDLNALPRLRIIDLRRNPLREIADIPGLMLNWGTWQRYQDRLAPEHIAGLWLRWHTDDLIEELLRLPRLCWLDLSFNRLTVIPESISRLQNLTALHLGSNRLTVLPEWISRLQNLSSLNLGDNQLTELPESISRLRNLTALHLRSNTLTELPEWISQLQNLSSLDLRDNRLTTLPEWISRLQNLSSLDLRDNRLTTLPASISRLQNLTSLHLAGNQLTALPEWISRLQNLTALNLGGNQLTEIPASISQLQNLAALGLGGSQLTALPEWIGRLQNLTALDLGNNPLTKIPESITRLQNLSSLNLWGNRLTALPEWIGRLQNLTALSLWDNQLTALPEWIGWLQNLTALNLGGNQLTELPESISRLQNLRSLLLEDNPIQEPPLEALDLEGYLGNANLNKFHAYLRQRAEQGIDHLYEAKLLIVGEAGAGKTSLARRIQNAESALPGEDDSTKGIAVASWSFPLDKNRMFRVNIWDFGGQEIYHSTHQFFLTKRSLYVLVADTRRDDTNFYWWLNIVELLSDNSPVFIVKNEKDGRFFQMDEGALRERFANLDNKVLSANLASNRGLDQILDRIRYHVSHLPPVGAALPKFWVQVRAALENDPNNYIDLDKYLDICKQQGFKRREDMLQLSGYLHDLGVCLHFQDDDLLIKTVILKPEWGTRAVYKVLDNNEVKRNFGRFRRDDLAMIWCEDEYIGMHGELLRLMMNFKLCYELEDAGQYIAPQLLSKQRPDYHWDARNNLLLRYTYQFMPKGILTRFIVAMHPYIAEQRQCVWQSGVVLGWENTRAEIVEDYDRREIRIRVAGQHKRDLLTVIQHELDRIHDSFRQLRYEKLIPCRCRVHQDDPEYFKFKVLQNALAKGITEIQCQKCFEMIKVQPLVDDVLPRKESMPQRGEVPEYMPERIKPLGLISKPAPSEPEVFISYACGGESERIVNELQQALQARHLTIVRDKQNLGYKGNMREFMQRIGKGRYVIAVISDKYLKSENCMFELLEIAKNGNFYQRIFPIVLNDANIYRAKNLLH